MKKFLPLIILTSAFIPTLYGTSTSLPTDIQKKYDNLMTLIQNADVEAFKPAFDSLSLPADHIITLQKTVTKTKTAITNEIKAMGNNNKNWSTIAKGGLATASGSAIGLAAAFFDAVLTYSEITIAKENRRKSTENDSSGIIFLSDNKALLWSATAIASLLAYGISYTSIAYGIKTLLFGWNHKQQLQNKLTNLDAIVAYMTGTSSATTSPSLIAHIKNADTAAFTNELNELLDLNQTANKPYIAQKNYAELEQCALETKNNLEQELREALSNGKNIAWKKLIGGSLVCLPSGFFTIQGLVETLSLIQLHKEPYYHINIGTNILWIPLVGWLSSKVLTYSANIASDGWHYQQQLREKLKNLNIIIAQINQAKA